jgi:hypothetical protein
MLARIPTALLLSLLPTLSSADRVNRMTLTERCVYTAQLSVAGYHYFLQGKARSDVPIRWHGDETQNEMDFVNQILDRAYAAAEQDRRDHPDRPVSEQAFGERAYQACIDADRS